MDLILWRHAQAHLQAEGQSDLDRALTGKGRRQAKLMAAWLNQRLAHSTRVLVSPARRTLETVHALGRKFKIHESLGPHAAVDDLLVAARWPESSEPVLIVGHQPLLGLLAARLLAGADQPWHVKKGAVWWLKLKEQEGQAQVILQAVQSPDCVAR